VTGAAFERVAEEVVGDAPIPLAELAEWRERYGVVAGITERGPTGDFSLGLWSGEPRGGVGERWRAFRRWMAPRFPSVVLAHQVHSATVLRHRGLGPGWHVGDGYDGHVTAERGLLLTVTVADCVPIYLVDRRGRGLALLHAGWRGTAAGMIEAGIGELCDLVDGEPTDLALHLGVGICGACYEVGPEVAWAVRGDGASGPVHLDLRTELALRARRLGVSEVSISAHCSAHDDGRFFSHRASGGDGGRMVAYLGRAAEA
jgi:purine-nucleoside/S-methyl-5'-thioadenosine phosphorylase / adenosine deaminase